MMGDDINLATHDDGFTEYVTPLRKRKKRSKVWRELLEGKNVQGERIAKCMHCNLELTAHRDRGTSHLRRHLERCVERPLELRHGDDSDEENFIFDMSELRKEIGSFIAEGAHSFSIVEEKGFRRMMTKANPNFLPFGRATVKRELLSTYILERDELKDMLSKISGRISLTTDNWKSNHTRQHFICVTAHFIDDSWKLHKRILRFRALAPPYDGVSIANELGMFLNQWKLDDKILSITVDNATYNDVMVSTLKRRLVNTRGLSSSEGFFHIRCCAHIINLIVQNGLTCISDILDKIRSLIKMITKSSHRSHEFYDCAERIFHLDKRRRLSLDMQVRWNSTYQMLGTALYFKDVFIHLGLNHSPFKSYIPLEDEWDKVRVIHDFLALFYEATCMFSAVKYPTSNLYFKGAWMVHRHLLEAANGPYVFLKEMVLPMVSKFDKYWSEYNIHLSCAAILDPRYKIKFVEYCFSKLFGNDEGSRKVNSILRKLNEMYHEYKVKYGGVSPVVASSSLPNAFGSKNYFDDYDHFVSTSSRCEVGKSQLDMYLDDDSLELNAELDILEFWHQSSIRYPILSKMAQDLLTIPVSTVASESAFSLGGKTISASRSSLNSKTVQALICLQDWHRAKYNIEDLKDSDYELDDDDESVREEEDDVDPFF